MKFERTSLQDVGGNFHSEPNANQKFDQFVAALQECHKADGGYGASDEVYESQAKKLGWPVWKLIRVYQLSRMDFFEEKPNHIKEAIRVAGLQQPEFRAIKQSDTYWLDFGGSKSIDRSPVVSSADLNSEAASSNQTAAEKFEDEFIRGSAIDPALFAATIRVTPDTIRENGEVIETPIHDALNWKFTRFGQQANKELWAARLLNECGSTWQAKLDKPRKGKDGKVRKYETPIGNGSRAYLPHVPAVIRQRIAERYGVEVPLAGSFWDWLQHQPHLPIVWTEGGKKSLSLLSLGYIAIALYGVNGGYSKNAIGDRMLIADVQNFAQPDRPHLLVFDQDAEDKTRQRVSTALWRFGELLQKADGKVSIVQWSGKDGKGIDDLIVNRGAEAVGAAIEKALPLGQAAAQFSRATAQYVARLRLLKQLKMPASLTLKAKDLSSLQLGGIPDAGIVAAKSPKGTGKTKFAEQLTRKTEKVLLAGHRVALMRNLCHRLNLDYRGDLDRANGRFINGSSYSLGIGFCVDSLLAIDPKQFEGCDLVIDEVTQVLRHLLQSGTCNKDGKRPALLARFCELVCVARRVIVADADLDDASLEYIQALRSDGQSVFLIRNDIKEQTYPCRFIECPNSSAISAELLADARTLVEEWKAIDSGLAPGPKQLLWICSDTKADSIRHGKILEEETGFKALVINSDTSGYGDAKFLISTPDTLIAEQKYPFILASPSLGTGVSVEIPGHIKKVYGLFSGHSLDDGDMAQSLGRVREPVQRVVWCALRGAAFNKISRSTNPSDIATALKQRSDAIVRLTRSQLRPDTIEAIGKVDPGAEAAIKLYSEQAAAHNWSQWNLRDALLTRLRVEGAIVTVEERESDKTTKQLLRDTAEQINLIEAHATASARDLSLSEKLDLESKEFTSAEDRLAVAKFNLKDFYRVDEVDVDLVLADRKGRRRAELLSLEAQIDGSVAVDRTVKSLEKAIAWCGHVCPWDISNTALRSQLRQILGLNDFLNTGKTWTKFDLKPYADRIRQYTKDIREILQVSISDKMSDVQIVHQLLSQLGVKVAYQSSRSVEGHKGEKIRVYRLNSEVWQNSLDVLERRKQSRQPEVEEFDPDVANAEVKHIQSWTVRFKAAATDQDLVNTFTGMRRIYPEKRHPIKQAVWENLDRDLKLRIERLLKEAAA